MFRWISPSSQLLPGVQTRRSQARFFPGFFPQPKCTLGLIDNPKLSVDVEANADIFPLHRSNILPKTASSRSIFESVETGWITIYNNHTKNLEVCRWHESFHNPFPSSLQLKQTAQSEWARFGAVIKRSQDRERNISSTLSTGVGWWGKWERPHSSWRKDAKRWNGAKWLYSSTEMEHHLSRNLDKGGCTSSTKF